jgi:hypothetical protein
VDDHENEKAIQTRSPTNSPCVASGPETNFPSCNPVELHKHLVNCLHVLLFAFEDGVMNKQPREFLKRAAECVRLAEAEQDPEMKTYLMKLAASWTRAAQESVDGALEEA